MSEQISIIIADDHPLFRKGLRQVVDGDPSLRIVGEAGSGDAALKLIRELCPQVAILDVDMPVMNGLKVTEELRTLELPTEIIILTMYKEEDMFNSAMDLGVKGYVLKEHAAEDIVQGIRTVAGGDYYISPLISTFLVNRNDRVSAFEQKYPFLTHLTPTERKVLGLVAGKKTSKEIAEILHVSYRTVENHRGNISQKLGLRGSHSLLKFAIENKSSL